MKIKEKFIFKYGDKIQEVKMFYQMAARRVGIPEKQINSVVEFSYNASYEDAFNKFQEQYE